MIRLVFSLIAISCLAIENESVLKVYEEIADIRHPTMADLRRIQACFTSSDRPFHKMPNGEGYLTPRIIGDSPEEIPVSGHVAVNCSDDCRENCIITYASFNRNYPQGLKRLVEEVSTSDFVGHILYRTGGWPNVENGDLVLAHVPLAFKICFFREAKALGYKRVLWMDTSILPLVSLNQVFEMISEKGYFILRNWHTVGQFMNEDAAKAFGLTLADTDSILSCQGGLMGIDFTQQKPADFIDALYAAAKHPTAFFSTLCDQSAISILMHQMNMLEWGPREALSPLTDWHPSALFLIDRDFVKGPPR